MATTTSMTRTTTNIPHMMTLEEENLIIESTRTKITELMIFASKLKLKNIENLCHVALENISGKKDPVRHTNETYNSRAMMAAGLSLLDINFNLRFARKWDPKEKKSLFNNLFTSTNVNPYDYESVTSEDILNAPIMDICIIQRNEVVPEGYFRLSRTPSNKRADLNTGSTGHHLYLCIKKMASIGTPPITSLVVIYPDKKEYVPPGFSVVKRGGKPCNLNSGTSAERIFLCYKRDHSCNPIIDLQIYFPTKNELLPNNFSKLSRSIRNYPVDLNMGTGAPPISICIRYSIASLDCLIADNYTPSRASVSMKKVNNPPPITQTTTPVTAAASATPEAIALDLSEHWEYEKESRVGGSETKNGEATSPIVPVKRAVSVPHDASAHDRDFSLDRPLSDSIVFNKLKPIEANEVVENIDTSSQQKLSRRGSTPVDEVEAGDNEALVPPQDEEIKPEVIADVLAEEESEDIVPSIHDGEDEVDIRTTRIVTIYDEPIPRTFGHILRAVLAALFTTGEMFETALDTLNVLLLEDTIFKYDYLGHPSNENNLTMLDLAVHILCERLDCCIEVVNNNILQVLNRVILKSHGRISKICVQKIFRATTLVATAYSTRGHWVTAGYPEPVQDDGKEIFAYTVLKELIKYITALAEESEIDHSLPISQIYFQQSSSSTSTSTATARRILGEDLSQLTELGKEMTQSSYTMDHLLLKGESYNIVCDIVMDFFDDVMDGVETSRVTESVLLAISKKTSSTLSPSFWIHMNTLSLSLFRTYEVQNAFILLAALCKWSWLGIKTNEHGEAAPRHLGNKLLSLEALRDFCRVAGPKLRVSKIMGYQIRRIVVSSIFTNMQYSTIEPRIFAKLLKLVSSLWENWREQIRLEFPVICQQIMIKILQAPTKKMPPILHMICLKEIVKWFDQPHMLVEMFVNFDMDVVVAADWNIFAHIIRAICFFAEKASRPIIPGTPTGPLPSEISIVGAAATMFGTNCVPIHPRDVKIKALEVVTNITRAIMDATGHANLIYMDMLANDANVLNRGWISKNIDDSTSTNTATTTNGDASSTSAASKRQSFTIKNKREATLQTIELLQQALRIYQEKESVGKAVKFLLSKNFMSDTPHEIAGFVRIYKDSFDPSAIGDFLGEGGRNKLEEEYWDLIRYRFTRAVSFVDMELDDALRLYLTGCGFRMPGEAQKIDRFITAFVRVFWQDNHGTEYCPFHHEDTVHLLAYATIMLNTDLHRANLDKKKGGKKMTKNDFIKNLRGADQGNDINTDYLSRIYDNIAATPIEMEIKTTSQQEHGSGGTSSNTISSSSSSSSDGNITDNELYKRFFIDLLRNLRNAEDLLRSMSPYSHKFAIMGVDISISLELVAFMFESVWHNFHAIIDAILTKLSNEETIIFYALDILCNSLTSCIFLDLKVEKLAFATQLARFRQICELFEAEEITMNNSSSTNLLFLSSSSSLNLIVPSLNLSGNKASSSSTSSGNLSSTSATTTTSTTNSTSSSVAAAAAATIAASKNSNVNFASGNFRKEKWFISVEQSTAETAITAIAEVHSVISQIKDMIKQFARREATKTVYNKIEKKANIKENSRFFVMEGDLKKKSRTGKFVPYHFFLFSDILIYTHQGFSEYKVHGQLDLDCTTINSYVRDDATNCCFIIENPLKTFVAMAESSLEKQTWVRCLNETINSCVLRRKGQRLSILDRMQDQEKEVSQRQLMHENYSYRTSRTSAAAIQASLHSNSHQQSGTTSTPTGASTTTTSAMMEDHIPCMNDVNQVDNKELKSSSHQRHDIHLTEEIIQTPPTDSGMERDEGEDKDVNLLTPGTIATAIDNTREGDNSTTMSDSDDDDMDMLANRFNDPMLAAHIQPSSSSSNSPRDTHLDNKEDESHGHEKKSLCHSPDHANLERKKMIPRRSVRKSLNEKSDDEDDHSPLSLCSEYLAKLDEKDVTRVFMKALKEWKSLIDSKTSIAEHQQYQLFGLYKVAKEGPPPPKSPTNDNLDSPAMKQYQAWKDSSENFSSFEAQKYFILTLKSILSEWDYHLEQSSSTPTPSAIASEMVESEIN